MKASEWMDEFVNDLIAEYSALEKPDGCIWLELRMPGRGRLLVEELVKRQEMRVAYILFDEEATLVIEPEIRFHIGEDGHWYPYQISRVTAGRQICANLDAETGEWIASDEDEQAALADFSDAFAEILRSQQWIGKGSKRYVGPTYLGSPDPMMDAPDPETMMQWMEEEGGCEATDGCWVEPDGVCPHGYQSWLLVLGMI